MACMVPPVDGMQLGRGAFRGLVLFNDASPCGFYGRVDACMHFSCMQRRRLSLGSGSLSRLHCHTHGARYRSMKARSEHRSVLEVLAFVPLIMEMGRSDGLHLFSGPYSQGSGMCPSTHTLTVQQGQL